MAAAELGPWEPMSCDVVVELFSTIPIRWWFAGGTALELHTGRSWRSHDDIDVGVCRAEASLLASLLDDWQIHVAAAGELRPWRGEGLLETRHENNLWLRRPGGAWCLDVAIGEGDGTHWTYRRDHSLRLPWDRAVHTSPLGHRYLDPALQLLFKSRALRPKDDVDAVEVVPDLDDWGVALLDVRLGGNHPWRPLVERRRRPLTGADVLEVLHLLSAGGADVWVDGGWGVDALLGDQTRQHADLDLALPTRHWSRALGALDRAGFTPVRDDGPYNVVMLDDRGRLVDDWHDVRLIHERFGLPVPADYARWGPTS